MVGGGCGGAVAVEILGGQCTERCKVRVVTFRVVLGLLWFRSGLGIFVGLWGGVLGCRRGGSENRASSFYFSYSLMVVLFVFFPG